MCVPYWQVMSAEITYRNASIYGLLFWSHSGDICRSELECRSLGGSERVSLLGRLHGRTVLVVDPGRTSTGFGWVDDVACTHRDVTTAKVKNALVAREEVTRPVAGQAPAGPDVEVATITPNPNSHTRRTSRYSPPG